MMGIKMRLHDGEPLSAALRRFRKLVQRTTHPHVHKWHQRAKLRGTHVKRGLIQRRKKYIKLIRSRMAHPPHADRRGPIWYAYGDKIYRA